ncbi:hypothetical protein [Rufibacter tibetensis]|uniref:hypothetical protein n=1 Tax=Rufibacter tibetensis TaxID=512763 RepID=UPI0007811C94|nr:hypothetical protein [Rufibacter tibetensis]
MKIHLIRSSSFTKESYSEVLMLLKAVSGPLNFISCPDSGHRYVWRKEADLRKEYQGRVSQLAGSCSFDEREEEGISLEWQDLFDLCTIYRGSNNIPEEDYVIFLTPIPNPNYWFCSFADQSKDIFIHTDEWGNYLPCSSAYPIAYLIVSQVLQKLFYGTVGRKLERSHEEPRGCMNDFCREKAQILFKLRTADICPDCIDEMMGAGVRGDIINQAIVLFELARKEMLFRQRFRQLPSRMHITSANVIHLVDYQNKVIDLSPLEKTVYFLLLKYPEGIVLADREQYREDIALIYSRLNVYAPKGESLDDYDPKFAERVNLLANRFDNSLNEKISRIKKRFEDELGKETARYYFIQGERNKPRRVLLDRTLITCESDVFGNGIFPHQPAR